MFKLFKADRLKNEGPGYTVFQICNFLFMLLVIVVTLLPYLNVLAKALNEGQDSLRGGIYLWPRKFTFENFTTLLSDRSIYNAFFVSIGRVVICTLLGIITQFMAAYALSKRHLPGMKTFTMFLMIPMFVSGGIIPQYVLFSQLNLLNNFWVYVFPGIVGFYNITIMRSYVETSIPESILEAAQIDGLGEMGIFTKFIVPLSKPVLATTALWMLVNNWNDWSYTLYYITDPDLFTLQYKLMQAIKESEKLQALIREAQLMGQDTAALEAKTTITTDALTNAQVIVVTVPIICVYPFLQKYFIGGITLGAVKG